MRPAVISACAIVAALLCGPASGAFAQAAPAGATLTAEIERLVPLLGSRDAREREKAAADLARIGAPALAALETELARLEAPVSRLRALLESIRPTTAAAGAKPNERWYEAKYREASRRMERGDHLGAVKILDAILVLEPEVPIRDRIQTLKIRAKELQLRSSIVEARLIARRVLLVPGAPVQLEVEVKNVSSGPLELAPSDTDGQLFGALEVETVDAAADGTRSRLREVHRITAPIRGRLAPGEALRAPVTLRPDRPLVRGAFRRLTIAGAVRSLVLQKGDERFDRFLPLFPVEVFVVDRPYHALAADPPAAIAESMAALRASPPPPQPEAAFHAHRLFLAALLTPAARREASILALAEALERDEDAAGPAAMTALAALTERPASSDRAAWREYLRKRAD